MLLTLPANVALYLYEWLYLLVKLHILHHHAILLSGTELPARLLLGTVDSLEGEFYLPKKSARLVFDITSIVCVGTSVFACEF